MLEIICGDALETLKNMEYNRFQAVITSPPYYQLRDYGIDGQVGQENTPEDYVNRLADVFDAVKNVLKDDGTLWIVIADTYSDKRRDGGIKPKDLIGIPWMLAFELRRRGWHLRQEIIWEKPNPMPESVRDRCTRAHETIFMLSKKQTYAYYADAIKERSIEADSGRPSMESGSFRGKYHAHQDFKHISNTFRAIRERRNKRNVWTVPVRPYKGAHFAVFPESLVEPCVLASTVEGDDILDPFAGSGTTGVVALQNNRNAVLIDLNPDYCQMMHDRLDALDRQILLPLGDL